MKLTSLAGILGLVLVLAGCSKPVSRVACVGDSITEGYGLAVQSKTGYPVQLDSMLGPDFAVMNMGRSATTLQKKGDFPYWICKEFSDVFVYRPNIIVIMLGTNDTKPQNWNAARYQHDYQALIDTFRTISTHPRIYLNLPPKVFKTKWGINDSTMVHGVLPIVKRLAQKNKLPLIDVYDQMARQGANFSDSIHPNADGAKILAGIVAQKLRQ